ncbi:MAG: thioredoxin family protein [Novosphingobium sp.]|nr:thioredoxin family protein [Novosphingobium sp.]
MALPMGLTALALAWLAWRIGGEAFATACLVAAILLLGLLALAGSRQRRGLGAIGAVAAGLGAILLVGAVGLPPLVAAPSTGESEIDGAEAFSAASLAAARAEGKPVFVYFTADWCLTCKVNETAAIERDSTRAAFEKAGVTVLRGDWTRRDPAITRFLAEHGAAGVPLYLWYAPGTRTAKVLPQVLSPALLEACARGGSASSECG